MLCGKCASQLLILRPVMTGADIGVILFDDFIKIFLKTLLTFFNNYGTCLDISNIVILLKLNVSPTVSYT